MSLSPFASLPVSRYKEVIQFKPQGENNGAIAALAMGGFGTADRQYC
jgi:hypothetical protein